MSRAISIVSLLLVALLVISGCQPVAPGLEAPAAGAEVAVADTSASEASVGELTIDVTADGVTAPAEVVAGPVRVTLLNTAGITGADGEPVLPDVARVVDGATLAQVEEAMAIADEDPNLLFEVVQLFGYPFAGDGAFYWDLIPGAYGISVTDSNEIWGEFTVIEGESVAAPESAVTLELDDFAFLMPETIAAGPQIWEMTNIGEQLHEIIVVRLEEGTSVSDLLEIVMADDSDGPPPFELVAGYAPFSAGIRVWFELDLAPGTYGVICFIPDFAGDFSPHFLHGMARVVTVE